MTKHRSTLAPWECEHCGYTWYGIRCSHRAVPDNIVLCTKCHCALDNYLWNDYEKILDGTKERDYSPLYTQAVGWINNKKLYPKPRPLSRKYNPSVPHWMRDAIQKGFCKTNSTEKYIITSLRNVVVDVTLTDVIAEYKFKKGR